MQKKITEIVDHISHNSKQLARIVESERHITSHLSEIVQELPSRQPDFCENLASAVNNSQALAHSIIAYLNSLADLEQTIADQLSIAIRKLKEDEEEE